MVSPTVDRRFGLVGNIPMKAPVTVLAAGNITQSGQQTVDGVAVLATNAAGVPDRVLCTGMTDGTKNGIWDVSTAAWTRAKDADGNYDLGRGSTVLVNAGSTYGGTYWRITNTGAITIGTTSLAWTQALSSSLSTLSFQQAGTGAVVRSAQTKMREIFNVDDFGAVGDGVTDDSAALALAAAAVTANDGGVLEFRPYATYMVGGQTVQNPPLYTYFTWPPNVLYPIELASCTKPVVIRGNGATIKCLANAKYGTFNTDGTPLAVAPGYIGVGASSAYYYMIYVHNCNGVHIENLELDGNLNNLNVNGHFSDVGIQLQGTGLFMQDNNGPVVVSNLYSHHHGLDNVILDGLADNATNHKENGAVIASRFECCGRNNLSVVGGKGWSFYDSTFNYSGRANRGSDTLGKVSSNPGAGVDFEAEGTKEVRDLSFHNCEFIGNAGQGIVADSGTDVDRIKFYDCTFIGTTNYSVWPNRPGLKFYGCRIIGTMVSMWDGTSGTPTPYDAAQYTDCILSNDPALSPTGAVFTINRLLIEGGSGYTKFLRCKFSHAVAGTGTNGNYDGVRFEACEFVATAGTLGMSGRYAGPCLFNEAGGVMQYVPGVPGSGSAAVAGKTNGGSAEDAWYFRTGGVTTLYPATIGNGFVGYTAGDGSTVTQLTSKSQGVTLDKVCGQITMHNAGLAGTTSVSFTLTNSKIVATDVVNVSIASGATVDAYTVTVTATAGGTCRIQLRNESAGLLGEALVLNFSVLKAVAA